ncbi:4-hydroxybenzoate 3-monooxygenase [Alphaproteobacteria bacterium]|nr:4-hydroxybenzoate 3-monooxygenase [Alphaproteobacteria bacterium]
MTVKRTKVAIIGAGPSGLLLGRLLDLAGIDNIVLERQTEDYVLSRIRAGILEQTTVDLLHRAEAGDRLRQEGIPHHAVQLAFDYKSIPIGLSEHTNGKVVTAYGQTEVTRDLCDVRAASGATTIYQADDVALFDFDTDSPYVTYSKDGVSHRIDCDLIAGCDGYHGPSRAAVPKGAIKTYEKIYPFGWLGLLADTKPVATEVVYANTDRGFALCSMRSHTRSRYYIQCDVDDNVANWSDDAFWDELRRRLPPEMAEAMETGPSIEKSIAPLRSFVAEPMCFGRLLLAGDAAHVVPPTGAKGLNLAASDIHYLYDAMLSFFADKDASALPEYSRRALDRVWKTERFSWWLTTLTHRFTDDAFEQKMKEAELAYITTSDAGRKMVAENYVGLPL